MSLDNKRRNFLRKGVAVGTAVGLAGCSGGGDDVQDTTTETTTVDATQATPEPDKEYKPLPKWTWTAISRNNDPQLYEWSVMARQQLERLGLRFNWEVLQSSTWVDRAFARKWDFNQFTWFGTVERLFPYYNLFYSFHSSFANKEGGNFSMWTSDEYDKAVESFNSSLKLEAQKKWANRCQQILAMNQPVLFGVHPATLSAASTQQYSNWKPMFGLNTFFNRNTLRDIKPKGNAAPVIAGSTAGMESYPNFFGVTGNALETHHLTYDTPVYFDYEGNTRPAAAKNWNIIDNTTIDVTLREGMKWHDGEEVTAEDLKWTWDALQEFGVPYLASDTAPYKSSEIQGKYKVRFKLKNPFSGFIKISLYRVPILPKHVWDGITEEKGFKHPREWSDPNMTGSGMFQFVTYEPGNRIVFKKNPNHRFADQIEFDQLVYKVYGNQSSLVGDLTRGRASFAQQMGPNHWDRAKNASGTNAIAKESLATNGVWVRCDKKPFNDVLVRRALAHALNEQEAIDIIYRGQAMNAVSPISPANKVYFNSDVPDYQHSLDRARQLLTEAGLRWDDQGRLMMPTDWEPTTTYVSPDS